MKLEEAINTLQDIITYAYSAGNSDDGDAIKLGLHAIQRIQQERLGVYSFHNIPLLGETVSQNSHTGTNHPDLQPGRKEAKP